MLKWIGRAVFWFLALFFVLLFVIFSALLNIVVTPVVRPRMEKSSQPRPKASDKVCFPPYIRHKG